MTPDPRCSSGGGEGEGVRKGLEDRCEPLQKVLGEVPLGAGWTEAVAPRTAPFLPQPSHRLEVKSHSKSPPQPLLQSLPFGASGASPPGPAHPDLYFGAHGLYPAGETSE